ncbi:ABC transporter [Pithovirus sibericum]|uniref:ABC2 type transporter superfamily protein n=1 Tax=Pithovirus sibericum TaxID=1450746 RepID=W5SAS9_9VIRU|nr:ABC transporter [Pithovirus sibericum]AHH01890.1 ABC2 type transporter superfamily protein [Pithovirus sibericum]
MEIFENLEMGHPQNFRSKFCSKKSSENLTLEWENICYSVSVPVPISNPTLRRICNSSPIPEKVLNLIRNSKEKRILNNLSGRVEAGQFVAIMGPSGAGKSTLLNILAGRIRSGVSGQIRVQGEEISHSQMKRLVGYSTQNEVFFPYLTVRDTILFTSKIKSSDHQDQSVDEILEEFNLTRCANTLVGGPRVRGVSGGERKRASIANELVSSPSLIFLDEPTSGLDFSTARDCIQTLRQMANNGHTVLITIHQPSSTLFNLFDKILLMTEGGFLAYDGKPQEVLNHMASCGFPPCPPNTNPADYLIEWVTSKEISDDGRPARWILIDEQETRAKDVPLEISYSPRKKKRKYALPFHKQFFLLAQRSFKQRKGEILSWAHVFQILILAFLFGVVWFQQSTKEESIRSRAGFMFYSVIFWVMHAWILTLYSFIPERIIVEKERASGTYSFSAYFLAKITTETLLEMVLPSIFSTVVFWMVGLSMTAEGFFLYLFVLWLAVLMGCGMGMLTAALISDPSLSIKTTTVLYTSSTILACFLVSKDDVPEWVSWARWGSLIKYPYEALMVSDLSIIGHQFTPSSPSIYTSFPIRGEDVLEKFNVETELWQSVLFLVGINVITRFLTYLALRFLNKPK